MMSSDYNTITNISLYQLSVYIIKSVKDAAHLWTRAHWPHASGATHSLHWPQVRVSCRNQGIFSGIKKKEFSVEEFVFSKAVKQIKI